MTRNLDKKLSANAELIIGYDVQNSNHNGDPQAGDNRPRIDKETNQGVATSARVKRFIRDQFDAEGEVIYMANARNDDGSKPEREDLLDRVARESDIDFETKDGQELAKAFLDACIDARLFGAPLSVDPGKDLPSQIVDALPGQITGAVQINNAKTYNQVFEATEAEELTSVIATKKGKESGGYGLDNKHIRYGFFGANGIVNANQAQKNRVVEDDIKLLDQIIWRSFKHQTITNSKIGHLPQFYFRIQYSDGLAHIGRLENEIEFDSENSKTQNEIRHTDDIVLNITPLVEILDAHSDRIDTIHHNMAYRFTPSYRGEVIDSDAVPDILTDDAGVDTSPIEIGAMPTPDINW